MRASEQIIASCEKNAGHRADYSVKNAGVRGTEQRKCRRQKTGTDYSVENAYPRPCLSSILPLQLLMLASPHEFFKHCPRPLPAGLMVFSAPISADVGFTAATDANFARDSFKSLPVLAS